MATGFGRLEAAFCTFETFRTRALSYTSTAEPPPQALSVSKNSEARSPSRGMRRRLSLDKTYIIFSLSSLFSQETRTRDGQQHVTFIIATAFALSLRGRFVGWRSPRWGRALLAALFPEGAMSFGSTRCPISER